MSRRRSATGSATRPDTVGVVGLLVVLVAFLCPAGCADLGDELEIAPGDGDNADGNGGGPPPVLTEIVPLRTVVGDTLWLRGLDFGDGSDNVSTAVLFSDGAARADVAAEILAWGDLEILARVPAGAAAGSVRVRSHDQLSAGCFFAVADSLISYATDVGQLFDNYLCSAPGCHRPPVLGGDLSLASHADLMLGGFNGPAVIPRHSEGSLLRVTLVTAPPTGGQMPPGGPFMNDDEVLVISDWIDQGARDN